MKFTPTHWSQPVTSFQGWTCPDCGRVLRESEEERQLVRSNKCKNDQSHDAWDPDWIRGRFAAYLHCNSKQCGSMVAISGDWTVDLWHTSDEYGQDKQEWVDVLSVKNVQPSVDLFSVPDKVPAAVRQHLLRAFSLFWNDKASCLNALRASLEACLSDQGVPKKFKTKKGTFRDAKLHQRIERFENKHANAAELMMAIKWLGNLGSHDNADEALLSDKVDSALTIMAVALFELYDPTKPNVQKLVKTINRSKG